MALRREKHVVFWYLEKNWIIMDVLTLMGLVCFKACYYLNAMPQFKEGETCSRHTEIL